VAESLIMAVAWLDAGLREKIEFQVLKYLQHFEHILAKEQCSEAGLDCLEAELADVNVNNHAHGNVLLSNGHTFLHYYHMQTRTSEDWGPSHDKASCVRARGEQTGASAQTAWEDQADRRRCPKTGSECRSRREQTGP
jgi:hypothetical protein